ncbi:MAG TPA: transposase [Candidatus Binatia bacterium]|nr:transposase [Candidatus Binatia bacterium]
MLPFVRMRYRRSWTPGGTYFFTAVTFARRPFFAPADNVTVLREAFRVVRQAHPFAVDAFVLLPDHLHCLWTLPANDHNFAIRLKVFNLDRRSGWNE